MVEQSPIDAVEARHHAKTTDLQLSLIISMSKRGGQARAVTPRILAHGHFLSRVEAHEGIFDVRQLADAAQDQPDLFAVGEPHRLGEAVHVAGFDEGE